MLVIPGFLFWTATVVLVAGALYLLRRAFRDADTHRIRALIFGVLAIGLGITVVTVHRHTYDAVVVEDDGPKLTATRMVTIGEPEHDPRWIYAKNPTWIFNRSSQSIYLEAVSFGGLRDLDPRKIKAGEVSVDERVDYLGPEDPPPKEGRTGDTVLWLRWRNK